MIPAEIDSADAWPVGRKLPVFACDGFLLELARLSLELLDPVRGRLTCRVAGEPFLARLQELFRPAVVEVLVDPFLAAQLSNAVLAAQAFQHNAGSSLQRNDAGVWLCEYPGLSFQRCPVRACSLVSSLLLNGATMSQESSLTQSAHSIRQVLTAYNRSNHPGLFEGFTCGRIVGCSASLWPALWDDLALRLSRGDKHDLSAGPGT